MLPLKEASIKKENLSKIEMLTSASEKNRKKKNVMPLP